MNTSSSQQHSQQSQQSADDLQKKLIRDEEWLRDLKDCLGKSESIRGNICSILDNFQDRIGSLNETIAPLHEKTGVIQRKQQNVKKLLTIIDASIQFFGKSMELENTVRDGSPAHLDDFLEKMESLKEAMSFFKTHQTYASKKENMQQTFESGCSCLETEFGSLIKSETQVLDPIKIIECLDEDYEIMSFRLTGMKTIKNVEKLNKIAKWMLKNGNISTIREKYAIYRSENIQKTLKMIVDQQSGNLTPAQRQTRAAFLKLAIKKATGRSGEKVGDTADVQKDATINSALLLLSAFLILSQLETDVCTAVFEDVTEVANVFRETIAKPLRSVLEKCIIILEQYEGSFAGMLLMAKFAIRNSNQLHTLSTNVDCEQLYLTFNQNVFRKSSQLISDFIDKLSNDHSRFVPEDGNVHQITSNTIKFLNILAKNRPTVNQILEITVTGGKSTAAHFFAQILAALGVNLKNKASTYPDESLSALFMLNNLNYVHGCLQDENVQIILGERSEQLASFYRTEITEYLTKYLRSWTRISAIFSSFDSSDKRAIKAIYTAFNKEFDAIIEAQKFYTISDPRMIVEIRRKVKDLVLRPYQDFCNQHSSEVYTIDRQLKYDVKSVEIIIDRLFSNS